MIQDQFRELRAAVREEDRDRAVEAIAELLDAYDQDRSRVRAQASLARSARESAGGTGPVVEAAQAVLETASRTNETKINVDTAVLGYLRSGDAKELEDELTTAIETHARFDEWVGELRARVADADTETPVFVTAVAPNQFVVPKGSAVDGELTVRNDTTTTAEDVQLSLQSDASLTLSPSNIDRIAGGEIATVTLSGSLPAGEYQPEITATVDGRSDSVSPYILVQNKRTYLERALNELVELYSSLAVAAARVEEATGNGNGAVVPPGIDNKARQIASRTIDIIDRIEGAKDTGPGQSGGMPPSNSINNQIGSVINQVSALQNQIASQAGTGLDADAGPQLRRDAGALIDIYEDAQEAAA